MPNSVQKRTVVLEDVCIADGGIFGTFNTRTDELYAVDSSHPDQCNFNKPLNLSTTATSPRSPEIQSLFQKLSISSLEGGNLYRYKRILLMKNAEIAAEKKDYKIYGLLFNATKLKAIKLDRAGTGEVKRLLSNFNLKGLVLKIAEDLPAVDQYTIPERKEGYGSVYLRKDPKTKEIEVSSRKPDQKININRKFINYGSTELFDSPEVDLYFNFLAKEFKLPEIFADVIGDLLIHQNENHRDQVISLDLLQRKINEMDPSKIKELFLEKIENQILWTKELVQQQTTGRIRKQFSDRLEELTKLKQFIELST